MKIKVVKNNPFKLPEYETKGSAGVDLQANVEDAIVLKPMERALVPTGLFIELPEGYEAQVRARSGLAIRNGISLVNGIGTIDSDYRGEIKVILINLGAEDFTINKGDRIAQMVIIKHERADFVLVEELNETDRGQGGFGHTGVWYVLTKWEFKISFIFRGKINEIKRAIQQGNNQYRHRRKFGDFRGLWLGYRWKNRRNNLLYLW